MNFVFLPLFLLSIIFSNPVLADTTDEFFTSPSHLTQKRTEIDIVERALPYENAPLFKLPGQLIRPEIAANVPTGYPTTGKRYRLGIIESAFHPGVLDKFMKKGFIDRRVVRERLVYHNDMYKKQNRNILKDKHKSLLHSYYIMQSTMRIYPHIEFVPLGTNCLGGLGAAFKKAIEWKVDAINMSIGFSRLSSDDLRVCEELRRSNIPIFIASGNRGGQMGADRFSKNDLKICRRLGWKNILFCGALNYRESRGRRPKFKEYIARFTDIPPTDFKDNFILAPGEKIPVVDLSGRVRAVNGTSVASPITAAAFLLLKRCVQASRITFKPHHFMRYFREYGRDHVLDGRLARKLSYNKLKVLDLASAIKQLEAKFGRKLLGGAEGKPAKAAPALPGNMSLSEFWRLNPGVREWALSPPDGKPRFKDGDKASELAYALVLVKHNPNINCKQRVLPGNVCLKLFWMQNPGVRDWALRVGKFKEGDAKGELKYAKTYYKWELKAKWDPRALPKTVSLTKFWKQNPGVRDWAIKVGKFKVGDVQAELKYAQTYYKWSLKAKWDPKA